MSLVVGSSPCHVDQSVGRIWAIQIEDPPVREAIKSLGALKSTRRPRRHRGYMQGNGKKAGVSSLVQSDGAKLMTDRRQVLVV